MKPQLQLIQFLQTQISLLPKNYQNNYLNIIQSLQNAPEYRLPWLAVLYQNMKFFFTENQTSALPKFMLNGTIQPPPQQINQQQIFFDLKLIQMHLKQLQKTLGKQLCVQLATQILGKEKIIQVNEIEPKKDDFEDLKVQITLNEQFIQQQYQSNLALTEEIKILKVKLGQVNRKNENLSHIEDLYIQTNKKLRNPIKFGGSQNVELDEKKDHIKRQQENILELQSVIQQQQKIIACFEADKQNRSNQIQQTSNNIQIEFGTMTDLVIEEQKKQQNITEFVNSLKYKNESLEIRWSTDGKYPEPFSMVNEDVIVYE